MFAICMVILLLIIIIYIVSLIVKFLNQLAVKKGYWLGSGEIKILSNTETTLVWYYSKNRSSIKLTVGRKITELMLTQKKDQDVQIIVKLKLQGTTNLQEAEVQCNGSKLGIK